MPWKKAIIAPKHGQDYSGDLQVTSSVPFNGGPSVFDQYFDHWDHEKTDEKLMLLAGLRCIRVIACSEMIMTTNWLTKDVLSISMSTEKTSKCALSSLPSSWFFSLGRNSTYKTYEQSNSQRSIANKAWSITGVLWGLVCLWWLIFSWIFCMIPDREGSRQTFKSLLSRLGESWKSAMRGVYTL